MLTRCNAMDYLDNAVSHHTFTPGSQRSDFIHQPNTHSPKMTEDDFRVLQMNIEIALKDIERAIKTGSSLQNYMYKPAA